MQITRIKATNFYGIKDPVEVSFIEGGKAEKVGYVNVGNNRISLINGFYGSNASGKSTLLNVIDVIVRLMVMRQPATIRRGLILDHGILLPNYHKDMRSKPTELEMDFVFDSNTYSYAIHLMDGRDVEKEILWKNGKEVFSREGSRVLFNKNIEEKIGKISEKIIAPQKSSFLSVLLDDSSDISVFENIKELIGVSELKKLGGSFCFITDKRTVERGQGNINDMYSIAIRYLRNNDEIGKEKYVTRMNNIAGYFEPGLKGLVIKGEDRTIEYFAEYDGFYDKLPVAEFSAGTRELIAYIDSILRTLKKGGVVVYDETSKYYHPDMELSILNLFKNKDINTNNAQILFSSHNHETFDLLFNDQAHIIEKSEDMIMTAHKVSDYDIQERDNVKKKYRLGVLGGVPDTVDFNRIINNLLQS